MSDVALMLLGMVVLGIILNGGWWLINRSARHPRPLLTARAAGAGSAAVPSPGKIDLPVLFRMSTTTQVILYVLLLSPPVTATIMMRNEWESMGEFLFGILLSLLHPPSLFLACIIYLLCPFTAWNIYWRRRDFIRVDADQIEYRSAFTTGKLVPGKITLFRGRSWRFDLTDLFRGQMASSWFLDIVPVPGKVKKNAAGEKEHVILDLKAMNLGGSAASMAGLLSQLYGDKFLINNQLPG